MKTNKNTPDAVFPAKLGRANDTRMKGASMDGIKTDGWMDGKHRWVGWDSTLVHCGTSQENSEVGTGKTAYCVCLSLNQVVGRCTLSSWDDKMDVGQCLTSFGFDMQSDGTFHGTKALGTTNNFTRGSWEITRGLACDVWWYR